MADNQTNKEKDLEDQGAGTNPDNENAGTNPDNENASNNDDKDSKGAKTFTQEQVNKMMAREKNQGRNSVYKEMGLDPKDSKMINMFKAFIESQKTDEEKDAEKNLENQTKAAEAESRALFAEVKVEAMMQGAKNQYVEDITTLVLSKLADESNDSTAKSIIGEFKTKYPIWFNAEGDSEEKGKVGQKGTGSSININDKKKGNDSKSGLGARLAAQRKVSSKKSSYWGKNN